MKKKNVHGEVFAVPLPDGTYIFGRIVLDLYSVLKRRLLPHDTPLFPGHAYLVEMYSIVRPAPEYVPSAALISGAYLQSKQIGNTWSDWPVVGEDPVDPRAVEFPESLMGFHHPDGDVAFCCGEIRVPVPMKQRWTPGRGVGVEYLLPSGASVGCVHLTHHSAYSWALTCLIALGRKAEVPRVYKEMRIETLGPLSLQGSDLRLSPFRAEIYKYLPFEIDQPYFEKQAQMGLNIERLYRD